MLPWSSASHQKRRATKQGHTKHEKAQLPLCSFSSHHPPPPPCVCSRLFVFSRYITSIIMSASPLLLCGKSSSSTAVYMSAVCSTSLIDMMMHASMPTGRGGWHDQSSPGGSGGPLAFTVNSARVHPLGGSLRTSSSSSNRQLLLSSSSYRRPSRPPPHGVGDGLCSAGRGDAVLRSFAGMGESRREESGPRRRGRVRARGANEGALCMMAAQQQRRQRLQQQPSQQQFQKANKPQPLSVEVTTGIVASISACEAGGGCDGDCFFMFPLTASILIALSYNMYPILQLCTAVHTSKRQQNTSTRTYHWCSPSVCTICTYSRSICMIRMLVLR